MELYLDINNTSRTNKDYFKKSFYLLVILFTYIQSTATTYTAIGCPGPVSWSGFTAGTCPFWNGGTQLTSQPVAGDNLIIPAGCTISVSGNPLNVNNSITVTVNGQLDFGNSNKLHIAAGSVIVVGSPGSFNAGNGGGNNNYIDIGATAVWNAAVGDVSGPFILTGGCVLTGSNPNTYSPAGCGITLLPIELLEFTGTCVNNGVQLNWSTATEINNDYFLVEKSDDGTNWKQVAKVKGLVNSYTSSKYIHIDYSNQNNLTYYRISQVDLSGIKTVFKAIDVYCSNTIIKDQMILYPNPSNTELNIVLSVNNSSPNTVLMLMDNANQIIFQTKVDLIKGVNSFAFPIDIPSGSYTAQFSSDNIIIPAQKLMIIR